MSKYDIAAFVWPAYSSSEPRARMFWPEGGGEWETVRSAKARYEGHEWPRKPLWGYVNEADPYVMQMQIDAAADHGVNTFIYDWYWYDNRPFLEQCLDDGFLKAPNRSRMKFYLMWANHDVSYGWDRRISEKDNKTCIWKGAVNSEQFRTIGRLWIEKYFRLSEYYKIDNKPVLAIYEMQNLIDGLGGIEKTREEMLWLDDEAKKNGLDGIHYQLIQCGSLEKNITGFDNKRRTIKPEELVEYLPIDSVTHYQFVHFTNMNRDYREITDDAVREWNKMERFGVPYAPHVSVGWDNTPRYKSHINEVVKNNTPENIERALRLAKEYADEHNTRLITVNSWNEWTETSYLQPDDLNGYGYLEAVKKVFKEL